jgi:hypothetical protein
MQSVDVPSIHGKAMRFLERNLFEKICSALENTGEQLAKSLRLPC